MLTNFCRRSTNATSSPSPNRTAQSATVGKPRVLFAEMKTVQTFDITASVDATKDQPAIPSLTSEAVRVNEYTLEELREIETALLRNPNQKCVTLKSGKRCQICWNLSIGDAPMSLLVKSNLVHKVFPYDEHEQGTCMVCPEDDQAILQEMKKHLLKLERYTKSTEKNKVAKAFIKQHFYLNWSAFYKRNQEAYDEATGSPLTPLEQRDASMETFGLVLEKLREDSNAKDVRHQNTLLKMSSDHKDSLKMFAVVSAETQKGLAESHERSHKELAESNERSQKELAELYTLSQKELVTLLTASHERTTDSILRQLATPKKPTKKKSSTERKQRRAPPHSTNIPMAPASAKKAKAAPVMERILKDSLPLNKKGDECGLCKRTWNTQFRFCSNHFHQLEEMTSIVHD